MSISTAGNRFRLWAPFDLLDKAGEPGKPLGRIRGIVSSESVDRDGEVVVQDGIDWGWFKSHGTITFGHPLSALNTIGEPLEIKSTDVGGTPATEMTGALWLDDKVGRAVWDKARVMAKSSKRRLGFSIEGGVLARDPENPKRVVKSFVHSVAVDPAPRNNEAWMEPLAAALSASVLGLLPDQLIARAEMMGYPGQGEGAQGAGGIPKLAAQSMQGVPDSAGRRALANGMSDGDLLVARLLKRVKTFSWAQGEAVIKDIRDEMERKRRGTTS